MSDEIHIPDGLIKARTTEIFTNDTVPAGLLKAHQIAEGVWGRIVVHTGTLRFTFEDEPENPISVEAGSSTVIPPRRRHHVELDAATTFAIEFHRAPEQPA